MSHSDEKSENVTTSKKKPNRCHYCEKKIKIAIEPQCKYCNLIHCIVHSAPDFHQCAFLDDYLNDQRTKQISNLLTNKCLKDKLNNRI